VADDEVVFEVDGDLLVPTELALGPWDPGMLHGGPVAAALLRAVESEVAAAGLLGHLARFDLQLTRPVPRQPMRARATVTRAGRRSQAVQAVLDIDDQEVSRATAMLVVAPPTVADDAPYPDDRLPEVESCPVPPPSPGDWRNYTQAVEFRTIRGEFRTPGPTACWMRLTVPMFRGEPTSPAVSVIALADFGNGISQVLTFDQAVFINPELTVYLHRPPVSAWVGLDSVTWMASQGAAYSDTALFDERGRIGRGVQALVVEAR
jgi:acyl-coenzyme A thioesterase PaaI-like protein